MSSQGISLQAESIPLALSLPSDPPANLVAGRHTHGMMHLFLLVCDLERTLYYYYLLQRVAAVIIVKKAIIPRTREYVAHREGGGGREKGKIGKEDSGK